jgi:predicted transcriptional regulator
MRTTDETAAELSRIAAEMDRSVSWLLNDLATRFIASRKTGKHGG